MFAPPPKSNPSPQHSQPPPKQPYPSQPKIHTHPQPPQPFSRYPVQNRVLQGRKWNPKEVFSQEKFISYFIDFIPEWYSSKRLFEEISRNERVIDVFIPAKRTVRGSRFGFAKFLKHQKSEAERLAVLNSLKTENIRLSFNLARYNVREGRNGSEHRKVTLASADRNPARRVSSEFKSENGRSFASALKGNLPPGFQAEYPVEVQAVNMGANLSWLCRSAIGTISEDFECLKMIPAELEIKLFGGDAVILTFPNAEIMHNILEARSEPWLGFFSDVHPWRSEDKPSRRVCWVTLSNVPVQSWQEENFRRLVQPFGRLVQIDRMTKTLERVDYAKVCIVTDIEDYIKKEAFLNLGGINHLVKIQEVHSWDLPYETITEECKLSTGGAEMVQSPLSCAFSPKIKTKTHGAGQKDLESAGPSRGINISSVRPKSSSVPLVSSTAIQSQVGPVSNSGPILADCLTVPPSLSPEKLEKEKSHSPSLVQTEKKQTSPDALLKSFRQKKMVHSCPVRKQSEEFETTKTCNRRIAFESPKKLLVVDRLKPTRLSKQTFERVSIPKKKLKKITENGSLRSIESPANRKEKGKADKGKAVVAGDSTTREASERSSFSSPGSLPDLVTSCPSRVPETLESQRTLLAVNRLKLAPGSSVDDLVKVLKEKVDAERGEWIVPDEA